MGFVKDSLLHSESNNNYQSNIENVKKKKKKKVVFLIYICAFKKIYV